MALAGSLAGTFDTHNPPPSYSRCIYHRGNFLTTSRSRSVGGGGAADLRHGDFSNSLPGLSPVAQDKRVSISRCSSASFLTHHGRGFGRYGATPGYAYGKFDVASSPAITLQSVDGRAQLVSSPMSADGGEVREDKFKPWRDQPSQRA